MCGISMWVVDITGTRPLSFQVTTNISFFLKNVSIVSRPCFVTSVFLTFKLRNLSALTVPIALMSSSFITFVRDMKDKYFLITPIVYLRYAIDNIVSKKILRCFVFPLYLEPQCSSIKYG